MDPKTKLDIDLLTEAHDGLSHTGHTLSHVASNLYDEGYAEHLAALASELETEADILRHAIQGKMQVAHDNEGADEELGPKIGSDHLHAVYCQRGVHERGKDNIKWYSPKVPIGTRSGRARRTYKRGFAFHHTAVKGGASPHKSRIKHWEKRGIAWELNVDTPGASQPGQWLVRPQPEFLGEGDEALKRWARAMALADRYRGFPSQNWNRGMPYQDISGPNSVLYLNLPADWVTFHGNGSNNDFIGYAWDGHSEHDAFDEDDLLWDFRKAVEIHRAEGHFADELEFTAHCAWTRKPVDPGKLLLEFIVDRVAPDLGAVVNLDFKVSANARSIGEVLRGAA